MERACESCAGQNDDDLELVHVLPAQAGEAGAGERTELWCFGCRTERAHELAPDHA